MAFVRFDDWSRLPGAEAEAWQGGMLLLTGAIDAATRDSAVAWLVSDFTGERFLLEKANGIQLRISREQFIRRRDPGSSSPGSN
jgi:hypothetical protein